MCSKRRVREREKWWTNRMLYLATRTIWASYFPLRPLPPSTPAGVFSFSALSPPFSFSTIPLSCSISLSIFLSLSYRTPPFLYQPPTQLLADWTRRPILHLNLVNLPELANKLWVWCLKLACYQRRYTASNAPGEGLRLCTVVRKSHKQYFWAFSPLWDSTCQYL